MKKPDPKYIESLVRQLFSKRSGFLIGYMSEDTVPGGFRKLGQESFLGIVSSGDPDINLSSVAEIFAKPIFFLLNKMSCEKLGQIIAYSLAKGAVCKKTFRKTTITRRLRCAYVAPAGRDILCVLAKEVLIAAVCDRLCVLCIARDRDLSWEDAGRAYLED